MTIQEYINDKTYKWLYNPSGYSLEGIPEFLTDTDFQNILSNYMSFYKGKYEFNDHFSANAEHTQTAIAMFCNVIYKQNAYMLQGMYDSMNYEYNPIENYRMIEEEEIKNTGTDTTTDTIGNQQTTEVLGAQKTTNTNGAQKDTMSYGNENNTNTHSVSPESTVNFINESRDVIITESRTDTINRDQYDNVTSTDKATNTYTQSTHVDEHELEHGHEVNRTLTRSGNIGVTTSQQMILSQRELVQLNIYKIVADLLVSTFCKCVWTDF